MRVASRAGISRRTKQADFTYEKSRIRNYADETTGPCAKSLYTSQCRPPFLIVTPRAIPQNFEDPLPFMALLTTTIGSQFNPRSEAFSHDSERAAKYTPWDVVLGENVTISAAPYISASLILSALLSGFTLTDCARSRS